jgi:WD40 repeat protein
VDLAYSPNAKFLAVVYEVRDQAPHVRFKTYEVTIWRTGTWQEYRRFRTKGVSRNTNQRVAFVGRKKMLAIARFYKPSLLWKFARSKPKTIKFRDGLDSVAGSSAGRTVAYGRRDAIELFDVRKKKVIGSFGDSGIVSYGKKDKVIASADDVKIRLFRARSGKLMTTIRAIAGSQAKLSFEMDGYLFAATGYGAPLTVYNAKTGELVFSKPRPYLDAFLDAALAPDGKTVAGGTSRGDLTVWNVQTGTVVAAKSF